MIQLSDNIGISWLTYKYSYKVSQELASLHTKAS